jgi:hypothetical protein
MYYIKNYITYIRRYYGRVQQAVHEYLELGPLLIKGDLTNPVIEKFFDPNGIVVVEAKRKDVNGQCTKKGNDCRGYEVRDSRWNDMKARCVRLLLLVACCLLVDHLQ